MKHAEFDTMNSITGDLVERDIEQIEDYANDLDTVGATKTAKYIREQVRQKQSVNPDLVRMYLSEDFAGG